MTNINQLINDPYWDEKTLKELTDLESSGMRSRISLHSEDHFVKNYCSLLCNTGINAFVVVKRSNDGDEMLDKNTHTELLNEFSEKMEIYILYIIHKYIMTSSWKSESMMILPINFEGFKKYSLPKQVQMAHIPNKYLMDRNLRVLIDYARRVGVKNVSI